MDKIIGSSKQNSLQKEKEIIVVLKSMAFVFCILSGIYFGLFYSLGLNILEAIRDLQ